MSVNLKIIVALKYVINKKAVCLLPNFSSLRKFTLESAKHRENVLYAVVFKELLLKIKTIHLYLYPYLVLGKITVQI